MCFSLKCVFSINGRVKGLFFFFFLKKAGSANRGAQGTADCRLQHHHEADFKWEAFLYSTNCTEAGFQVLVPIPHTHTSMSS